MTFQRNSSTDCSKYCRLILKYNFFWGGGIFKRLGKAQSIEQLFHCLLVAYDPSNMCSQQHAQCFIVLDNSVCCHTDTEIANKTCYFTQSQYTDIRPTSPRVDPKGQAPSRVATVYQFLCNWYDSTRYTLTHSLPLSAYADITRRSTQCPCPHMWIWTLKICAVQVTHRIQKSLGIPCLLFIGLGRVCSMTRSLADDKKVYR